MYKGIRKDSPRNLCGKNIAAHRFAGSKMISREALSAMLLLNGVHLDENDLQRIENGQRVVTDIELKALAKALQTTTAALLE